MKNFIAALVVLGLLTAFTAVNARLAGDAFTALEQALGQVGTEATAENAARLDYCIQLLEQKRTILHLSLRHTHIDALATHLWEAHAYCLKGDAPTMTASVHAAMYKIKRWKGAEKLSVYNIL